MAMGRLQARQESMRHPSRRSSHLRVSSVVSGESTMRTAQLYISWSCLEGQLRGNKLTAAMRAHVPRTQPCSSRAATASQQLPDLSGFCSPTNQACRYELSSAKP